MHPGSLMRISSHIDTELGPQADIAGLISLLDSPKARQRALKLHDEIDVYRIEWAGRDAVVKCYKHVGLIHSIRHTLKRSRARRGWLNARRLIELGVRTPRPLAYADEYRGPLLWRSFLVTEFEAGRRLDDLLADDRVSEGTKRRVVSRVLRLLDRLAAHGISHGDMKHTNVLCNGSRVILTDLDGMQVHRIRFLRRTRHLRDISRLLRGLFPAEKSECPPSPNCSDLDEALLSDPGRFGGERVVSSDGSRVWRIEIPFGSTKARLYLKEYIARSWLDRVKHLVRANRARRALKGSLLLARFGLKTPQVIAVRTLKRRCFMATIEVPEAHPAHEYFREGCEPHASSTLTERRQILRRLGSEVGRMHRAGIVHGDLRPGNILIRRGAQNWEFFFIDNERTRRWPSIPRRLRLKNLVQLNMLPREISNTDRLRFFHAYMLANPSVRLDYRKWASDVMAVTHRRFRKKGWTE
jgi:tRNA A-37 threonylcarbamoyl transferase component Bud32